MFYNLKKGIEFVIKAKGVVKFVANIYCKTTSIFRLNNVNFALSVYSLVKM